MSLPPLSANLQVKADHSCNWRCCFGCKDHTESPRNLRPDSLTDIEETTHKVTRIFHHHGSHTPTPRDDMSQQSLANRGVDKFEPSSNYLAVESAQKN